MYTVFLKAKEEISLIKKQAFISSLWGTREKMGTMEKFTKSIKAESNILSQRIMAVPWTQTIAYFTFKQNEQEIAFKWKNFLQKVYPDCIVDIDLGTQKHTEFDFVKSVILTNVADFPVTTEVAISKPLKKKEMREIKKLIKELKRPHLFYICRQFECDVCSEYNKETPFHFEIDFHYNKQHKANKGIEAVNCFDCEAPLEKDFCKACEDPYSFAFVI